MSTVPTFVQRTPAMKTVMRAGAVNILRSELDLLDVQRILLVCSGSVRRSGLYQLLLEQLQDLQILNAPDVPEHSSVELVERLAVESAQQNIQCIVAVGGGSCSDTAKAVALLMAEGGRLVDHASHRRIDVTPRSAFGASPQGAPPAARQSRFRGGRWAV